MDIPDSLHPEHFHFNNRRIPSPPSDQTIADLCTAQSLIVWSSFAVHTSTDLYFLRLELYDQT